MEHHLRNIQHVRVVSYHTAETSRGEVARQPVQGAVLVDNETVGVHAEGGRVESLRLDGLDPARFFDQGANQDQVYVNVNAKLAAAWANKVPSGLDVNPQEYALELLDAGQAVVIELPPEGQQQPCVGKPLVAAISSLVPNYFDLGMTVAGVHKTIHFNSTSHGAQGTTLHHSGDRKFGGNMLLQGMFGQFNAGAQHVVVLSGYNNTSLVRYLQHRPVVLVFDHAKRIIYVVSVPLDEFSVQNKITTAPLGITAVTPRRLVIEVFANAHTCNGFLSAFRDDAWAVLERAQASLTGRVPEPVIVEPAEVVAGVPAAAVANEEKKDDDALAPAAEKGTVLVFSGVPEWTGFTRWFQPSVKVIAQTSHVVLQRQGDDYRLHPGVHDAAAMTVADALAQVGAQHFPSLLPMEGGSVLFAARKLPALAESQNMIDAARHAMLSNPACPVVFVLGPMPDACRRVAGNMRINGLFLYAVHAPADGLADLERRREFLATLCLNAATAYAGPCATTLVAVLPPGTPTDDVSNAAYYFLDGVVPSWIRTMHPRDDVTFGTNVTAAVQRNLLADLAGRGAAQEVALPVLVDLNDKQVLFQQQVVPFDEFKRRVGMLSLDEIVQQQNDLCQAMAQAQRLFDEDQLKQHCLEMVALLEARKADALGVFTKQLIDSLQQQQHSEESNMEERKESVSLVALSADAEQRLKRLEATKRIKGEVTRIRLAIRNLVQRLGSMISQRKVSSMKFSLAQLQKRQTIAGNVDRANTMKLDEFEELLDGMCSEAGILWVNMDSKHLSDMLQIMHRNEFKTLLREAAMRPLIEYRTRDSHIDALTISLLLGQAARVRQDPIRPQVQGALVTSLPVSAMTADGLRHSSWYFPLLDRYMRMRSPHQTLWTSEANLSDIATLRIIARNTISQAAAVEELRLNIAPSSQDIGWFLMYMALGTAETLVARISDRANLTFDDTTCVNIRCLLGWALTIAASGNNPLSLVWQMFGNNDRPELPKDAFQWGLYAKMIRLAQYTGWDLTQLRKNVRGLLMRQINKMAITATEPLRQEQTIKKREDKAGHGEYLQRLHDEYYPGYHALVKYCSELRAQGARPDKQRMREFADLFDKFPNVRVRTGAIAQLMKHLKKNLHNDAYVDGLVADINYCWDNYDRRVKIKLLRYAKFVAASLTNGTYANVLPSEARADGVLMTHLEAIAMMRSRCLGKDRKEALIHATVATAKAPIVNHEHIEALLKLLESVAATAKPGVVDGDAGKQVKAASKLIFANEPESATVWRRPFDPLPQLGDVANPAAAAGNAVVPASASSSTASSKPTLLEEVRLILGKHVSGKHEIMLAASSSPAARLGVLVELGNWSNVAELVSLVQFAGMMIHADLSATLSGLFVYCLQHQHISADELEIRALDHLMSLQR